MHRVMHHATHRPLSHQPVRPAAWQRWLLATVATLLGLSGAAWLVLHYGFGAGAGDLPHPAEASLMRLHGAAAFLALFMVGVMVGHHVPAGWRITQRRRQAGQRGTGLALCGLFAVSTVTAYLLYYFAPESLRPALGWVHAGAASLMTAAGAVHGRHRARRSSRPSSRPSSRHGHANLVTSSDPSQTPAPALPQQVKRNERESHLD